MECLSFVLYTGVRFWVVRGETVFDDDAYPVPNELGSYVNCVIFYSFLPYSVLIV